MKIYTEKQLQEKINERMAQIEEHRWNMEHRERMEKQMYLLEERIDHIESDLRQHVEIIKSIAKEVGVAIVNCSDKGGTPVCQK